MERVWIEDIGRYADRDVEIRGWLFNKRSSGKVRFLVVRDGTGFLQVVMVKGEVPDEVFNLYDELTYEDAIIVRGKVKREKRAPGGYELLLKDLVIHSKSLDTFPIPKVRPENIPDVGKLFRFRHLWIRSRKQWSILRIRDEVERAIQDFFAARGFRRFDPPIFTPASVEGTTTLFPVPYFDEGEVYLTQSGQLYLEAGAMALGKVYSFGPTFRAEKSRTRRHLTEFWMVEPEVAWATLEDIMDLAEELVVYITERVLENRRMELEILNRDVAKLEAVKRPFPRITYDEAARILLEEKEKGRDIDFTYGEDFGSDEETVISERYDRPVMITHYPRAIKPFYMKPDPKDPSKVLCVDVIAPEGYGEIIGGSQREDDYEELLRRIREEGLPEDEYSWYLDLRKYGSVPHSGFGLGIERTVAWLSGASHVREVIPFARTPERIRP
ncbi:MAG: asparagine--tRNA ligase [Thermotogae bacterium]|nr:asparagine--tRNA ligase [Thermotogota bacterium]